MRIRIDDALFADFAPVIGVAVVRGARNGAASAEVRALLRAAESGARDRYAAEGALLADPRLAAWRATYKRLGAKEYRASADALIRRAIKGDEIPAISSLVDLYNAVSIAHALPIGGEDLGAVVGDLRLGYATGAEPFARLGSDQQEPPAPGEVIYADDTGAICRRWNWREAERTRIVQETADAVLVVDGLEEIGRGAVSAATHELAALVARHCGGIVTTALLDRERRVAEL